MSTASIGIVVECRTLYRWDPGSIPRDGHLSSTHKDHWSAGCGAAAHGSEFRVAISGCRDGPEISAGPVPYARSI